MKKRKGMLIASIVVVILSIIGLIISNISKKEKIARLDEEIRRSMTYEQVKEGDEIVEGVSGLKFDAFFLRDLNGDGYAESIRGTCREIGEEDTLYMELNMETEGYLENGEIIINSENFYFQTNLPKDDELAENYVGNNIKEIKLNTINNGTQKLITGIVRSGDYTYTSSKLAGLGNNINNYSKVNSVTLTGTYVDGSGARKEIKKEVKFDVDWHGETKAEISYLSQKQNLSDAINEVEGIITVDFRVRINEKSEQLILSKAHIEGKIPELSGYAPTKVEVLGTNVTYTYDEQTRKLTAEKQAVVDGNGNITEEVSRSNDFEVKVTYPIEAYEAIGGDTIEYRLPVTGYYEGYNNKNTEFTNPYKSNQVKGTLILTIKNPEGKVAIFEVLVGDYKSMPTSRYVVSKEKPLRIYNEISSEETNDTYKGRC